MSHDDDDDDDDDDVTVSKSCLIFSNSARLVFPCVTLSLSYQATAFLAEKPLDLNFEL